jgi:hypothetical protein
MAVDDATRPARHDTLCDRRRPEGGFAVMCLLRAGDGRDKPDSDTDSPPARARNNSLPTGLVGAVSARAPLGRGQPKLTGGGGERELARTGRKLAVVSAGRWRWLASKYKLGRSPPGQTHFVQRGEQDIVDSCADSQPESKSISVLCAKHTHARTHTNCPIETILDTSKPNESTQKTATQ